MKKRMLALVILVLVLCLASCVSRKLPEEPLPEISVDAPVDVIVDEPKEIEPPVLEEKEITLYFPDYDALYLHKEVRTVQVAENENLEMVVLRELFKGPEREDLAPSLTGEDLVNSSVVYDGGNCLIDFKSDFVLLNTGGSARETFAIASIVNSLCELDYVEKVSFTVEKNSNIEFGHFIIDSYMGPMTEFVKPE